MLYHYGQNNSGGSFDFDGKAGITHHVIIEAKNTAEANERAGQIGIYFDEEYLIDCNCCGTRWSALWDDDPGMKSPEVYGESVETFKALTKWMGDNPEVFVHYADGRIEAFQG